MAGIYVHIPFCKQACHYCDFHFSTNTNRVNEMVNAIAKELLMRRNYLQGAPVETIYFGGGTPSLLTADQIDFLLNTVRDHFTVTDDPEITLEANPDDLGEDYLHRIKGLINRLSIGIQSFREHDLRWMNRAHNAEEARNCLRFAQRTIPHFSLDLIYGIPGLSEADWRKNVSEALSYQPQHISAYCLTVESGTALGHRVAKGKEPAVDEEQANAHFTILLEMIEAAGYEQYEISNFCRDGYYARHNTSYWQGKSYLGVGPSAHSFDGTSRQWNVAHNKRYLNGMATGPPEAEREELSATDRFNERVMTTLRTKWGLGLDEVEKDFGPAWRETLERDARPYLQKGQLVQEENRLFVSKRGRVLADRIASDLFALDPDS